MLAVNLVNAGGSEGKLAAAFRMEADKFRSAAGKLRYVHFDFHHECGASNYGRCARRHLIADR